MRTPRSAALISALFFVGIFVTTLPAWAQDTPKVEASGGYQYLAVTPSTDADYQKLEKGWYVNVIGNANTMFGIVGDVGGSYKTIESTNVKIHSFMVGGRVNARKPDRKAVPFGHGLVGAVALKASAAEGGVHLSQTNFGFMLGGGANVMVTAKAGFRLGIDYVHFSDKSNDDVLNDGAAVNGFRLTVGVVVAAGR